MKAACTAAHMQTVMVVDDERAVREGLQQLLEMEGYPVVTAVHGQDALDLLGHMPKPGVILLDLMMPVMSGHQFLARLREQRELADIPVVALSAAPVTLKGVSAFLRKPPDLDELLSFAKHFCADERPTPTT